MWNWLVGRFSLVIGRSKDGKDHEWVEKDESLHLGFFYLTNSQLEIDESSEKELYEWVIQMELE